MGSSGDVADRLIGHARLAEAVLQMLAEAQQSSGKYSAVGGGFGKRLDPWHSILKSARLLHDLLFDTNLLVADDAANGKSSIMANGAIVIPAIPLSGNRDLDECLTPMRLIGGLPLPLVPRPDLAPIRTALVGLLPHLTTVIDRILNAMAPFDYVRIPPAFPLGRLGMVKRCRLKRWQTGSLGILLELVLKYQIANPIIVLDELEKIGGSERNGDVRSRLLGLLEPRRASSFFDPYLSHSVDLGCVSWLATANSLEGIPAPLQNRLEIIRCPAPQRAHLDLRAPQFLTAEYETRGLHPAWAAPLAGDELTMLRRYWSGGSLRGLRRLVAAVIDAREKLTSWA